MFDGTDPKTVRVETAVFLRQNPNMVMDQWPATNSNVPELVRVHVLAILYGEPGFGEGWGFEIKPELGERLHRKW